MLILKILLFVSYNFVLCYAEIKQELINLTKCEKAEPPLDDQDVVDFEFSLQRKNNLSFVKGNITIKEDLKNIRVDIKSRKLEHGKKKEYLLNLTNLTCKSIIIKIMFDVIKLNYTEDNCII